MSSKPSPRILMILFIAALLLTACQGAQTVTPTPDVNLIYTEAAKTIVAGQQATLDAMPSSTPTSEPTFTNTPEPIVEDVPATATALAALQVTAANTLAATALPTNTIPPAAATLAPIYATATPVQDRAELGSLSPNRGVSIKKSASWDMNLTIKNVGGKTWSKGYNLAYHNGDAMGSPHDYFLTTAVKPGESFTFAFTMTAPGAAGSKQVYWAFRDDNGKDMMYIDFNVNVTD